MERRIFLKIGSAAAAGPALWPAKGFSFAGHKAEPYISVGYLSTESTIGADSARGCGTLGSLTIMRAEKLGRGDRRFVDRGCLVKVHGLFPSPEAAEQTGLVSLSLEVSYEPFQAVSYRAWTYENVLTTNISHPASFRVPVTHERGLALSLFLRRAVRGTLAESEHAVRLSPGSEAGEPKLRRGTYFLGIHVEGPRGEERWERYGLAECESSRSEEDRWRVVGRAFPGFEPRPVGFPYLVLSVGYDGGTVEEMA